MSQMFVRTVLAAALLALVAPFVLPPVAHAQTGGSVSMTGSGQPAWVYVADGGFDLHFVVMNAADSKVTFTFLFEISGDAEVAITETHESGDVEACGDRCLAWNVDVFSPGRQEIVIRIEPKTVGLIGTSYTLSANPNREGEEAFEVPTIEGSPYRQTQIRDR